MSMPTPVVVFPEALVGEWTAIDTRTAPGLYAYRHLQAVHLLELPDFGGGDLDAAKRESHFAASSHSTDHLPRSLYSLAWWRSKTSFETWRRG